MQVGEQTTVTREGGSKAGVSCLGMPVFAVVCKCEASVCSCNRSCSCGCLKPLFAVVLAVVPGLKSPFSLAVAIVDALTTAPQPWWEHSRRHR